VPNVLRLAPARVLDVILSVVQDPAGRGPDVALR
jgi:hypothetical protein